MQGILKFTDSDGLIREINPLFVEGTKKLDHGQCKLFCNSWLANEIIIVDESERSVRRRINSALEEVVASARVMEKFAI